MVIHMCHLTNSAHTHTLCVFVLNEDIGLRADIAVFDGVSRGLTAKSNVGNLMTTVVIIYDYHCRNQIVSRLPEQYLLRF